MALLELSILVILVIIVLFVAFVLRRLLALAINSVIGFFALFAAKAFMFPDLVINIWSVLITAVGGIFGFIIVLILHFAGVAF